MRLGDLDDLKEKISELIPKWNKETEYGMGRINSYEFVIKIIDNTPTIESNPERPQGEWIPVNERLPEEGQQILYSYSYEYEPNKWERRVKIDKYDHIEMRKYPMCYMTHWAEMPSPVIVENEATPVPACETCKWNGLDVLYMDSPCAGCTPSDKKMYEPKEDTE